MDWTMTGYDKQRILLVSGPVAVGKTSVIRFLTERYGFKKLSSGNYLYELAKRERLGVGRLDLVNLGDQLDDKTAYRWVVSEVAVPALQEYPDQRAWVFDSVRKKVQVEHFRKEFDERVFHVHLTAPDEVLRERVSARGREADENAEFDQVIATANEQEARSLENMADHLEGNHSQSAEQTARLIAEAFTKWQRS